MTSSTIHGFPRSGPRRELKAATESHWAGEVSAAELQATARDLRRQVWEGLRDAGLGQIPSNHFSLYDHVLDTIQLVGAVPERFRRDDDELATYFAMARGRADAPAMEMTKWFDTNYHYIVPELGPDTAFRLEAEPKPLAELAEAAALGIRTRPVLLGPVTFLLLGKPAPDAPAGCEPLALLDPLLDLYDELLGRLAAAGADWVQLDEPAFVQDRTGAELAALDRAYRRLGGQGRRPKLLVASYFDHLGEALGVLAGTPVDGLALDFTRGGDRNLELLAATGGLGERTLVAGVVDGRNVWANDLERSLARLATLTGLAGEVVVSSSCSLQHVPLDLEAEPVLDPELRPWLAFARQKVGELTTLARGLTEESGVAIVQVDEPALREHLPLRRERHAGYLAWALDSFRLATAGVLDETQIHTHMCYSRFGEVLPTLAALDADVASIETARSGMGLLDDLQGVEYTQAVGPGVYDIHSPRVPPVGEMRALLEAALATLGPARLWVNPDCGLKTRAYDEVVAALRNMVEAAGQVRATLG